MMPLKLCTTTLHFTPQPHPTPGTAQVSRAYRKLSILVHPDKNPGEEAREAFEALNEAHRALKDKDKLVRAVMGWGSRC